MANLWFLGAIICSFSLVIRSTGFINHADWMLQLPKRLHNASLTGIAIPGSHDSASYSLNITEDLAPNIPNKVLNSSRALKGGEEFIRREIYLWSVTQRYNISQQLELGIRYFDLRVMYKEQENIFYIYHGLIGASLKIILSQMMDFLEKHDKEVIFLDFSHLYILTGKSVQELKRIVNKIFGSKIYRGKYIDGLCLSEVWRNQSNVIVFFREAIQFKIPGVPDAFGFNGSRLISPFKESKFYDFSTWKEYLKNNYKNRPHNYTFYVTQGIMQPNFLSIAASSLTRTGSLETLISDGATKALVKWLKTCRSGIDGINIVIADFVEKHNFIETVLSLNKK